MKFALPPALTSGARRLRSLDLWCAVVILTVITIAFFVSKNQYGSTAVYVGDANYYYAYLPSIIFDRDLDLTNQYVFTHNWYGFRPTSQGVPGNVFGIGPAVFALPFFLLGTVLSKLAGIAPTGFGVHEITSTLYTSAFFTSLATWPATLIIRRHFGGRVWPWFIAAACVAGTPLAYYAIRQPGYAHPFATFWITTFINHWDADRSRNSPVAHRWRWWLVSGSLLGAAILARPQCVTWGVLLLPTAWRDLNGKLGWRKYLLHALLAAAAATLVFSPQLLAWKAMYGQWLCLPQGSEFMRWDDPSIAAVLFSSRNGLFAFTPLVALCILGLFLVPRRHASLALALGFGFLLQAITNGAVWDWWAGGSFGGRRFDSCYVTFCFGLAAFIAFPTRLVPKVGWLLKERGIQLPPKLFYALGLAGAAALGLYATGIVAGNIELTAKISPPNLVSAGGTPLYGELRSRVSPPFRGLVVGLSKAVTTPARWLFARKYGAQPLAYDWVVGKHFLGEGYPGVNSRLPERSQTIALHSSQPFLVGAVPGSVPVEAENGALRILVPINRKHGPLIVRIDLDRPITSVQLKWNRRYVKVHSIGNSLQFETPTFRRGTNVLDVQINSKVRFLKLALLVPDNGLP